MLEEHINTLESAKFTLAARWTELDTIQSILNNRHIDIDKFKNVYAINVIEYFLAVLKQERSIGDCPIIHKMLNAFADADISSEEVFIICSQLKRTTMNFAFENGFASQENIDQINDIVDENFRGVIRVYDEIIHEHTNKLKRQQQQFLEYTNAINSSTIVSKADTKGVITYVNEAFEHISGYTKKELIGKPHNIVRHPDMEASFFKELWSTIKKQQLFYGIIKNRHKNGSEYYVKSYIIPILNVEGSTTEYISIRQDITELIHTLEHEQRLNVLKDDFIRNISHEIKTPLNLILGTSAIIQKKVDDPSLKKYIELINSGANQLQKIVSSIIELSQFNSGTYKSVLANDNLYTKFSRYLEKEKNDDSLHHLHFKYQIDPLLDKPLQCDGELFIKILSQLIDNAKKFNKVDGTIAVKISLHNDRKLLLQVKDNGQGIAKEQVQHIFDPFYQVDSSLTRAQEGLGIGLAITKKVVDILNGTISVESEIDKGTLLTVEVPLPNF